MSAIALPAPERAPRASVRSPLEALGGILLLIRRDPRGAEHAIVRLADALRPALDDDPATRGPVEARLAALEEQLRPHFLFNALNGILPLVARDPGAASRAVARLAELLSLCLRHGARDLIPLGRELAILKVYLEIQEARFADRLTASLDVPSELGQALVPSLILQPLLENAIEHGIAARPGPGSVEVRARRRDDRLDLVVRDDGPGPNPRRRCYGNGIGLRNTRDRLGLLYADDHDFSLRAAPGSGCEAALSIPLVFAS